MKRWALIAALSLPLPFAALPLVAIAFNTSAVPSPGDQPAAFEAELPTDEQAADVTQDPLGFSLNTGILINIETLPGCDGFGQGS